MSLLSYIKKPGPNGFGYQSTCYDVIENINLKDKTILITGCNAGLGKEMVNALSQKGTRIIGLARTHKKAEMSLAHCPNSIPVACELSEPEEVRKAAHFIKTLGTIDVLVCNAGIMALPTPETKYEHELQFLTNHLGHFILVHDLIPNLSQTARVVTLSSSAHYFAPKGGIDFDGLDGSVGYHPWRFYGQSKLANLLFARQLAKKLNFQQSAHAVHPGVIPTELGRHMGLMQAGMSLFAPLFMKTVSQGAATQTYVALHPEVESSGAYWADCNPAKSSKLGSDSNLASELWDYSYNFMQKYT